MAQSPLGQFVAIAAGFSVGMDAVEILFALENEFDVEFPERLLRRHVFESIASIRSAVDELTEEGVLVKARLADGFMARMMGGARPRIGVSSLNPHGGEGGLFGDEESRIIRPAVRRGLAEGMLLDGPMPADTLMVRARDGEYDAVVAMYHDQGHIAVKLVGFSMKPGGKVWDKMSGVNVTVGLPIIRTSVDHGVAFGKAGEGRANPQSMADAIKLAIQLSAKRPGGDS